MEIEDMGITVVVGDSKRKIGYFFSVKASPSY
jgi:hypothetical protein